MSVHIHSFRLDSFDPLDLHLKINPHGPGFLESPSSGAAISRYSIVPLRSSERYLFDDQGLHLETAEGNTLLEGAPLSVLSAIFDKRKTTDASSDLVFPGGFFGFFSYDFVRCIEELPRIASRDLPVPRLCLDWVDLSATYDHNNSLLTLASLDPRDDLTALENRIREALAVPANHTTSFSASAPQPVMDKTAFTAIAARAKEYIAAGDIYQANLSCRFDSRCSGDSADLYRTLRRINPSPFACLLKGPGIEIISSSPERLASLRGDLAETRPIAGTRPRGYTPPEDHCLGEELLGHPKERAEHIMLLDLERNDLGKVCRPGTVEVDELMVLERYSHVTHIVSNVRGRILEGLGPLDLLAATFPGGTITGVPKKRCMEIIEELEPTGRGTYTGSAGYIGVNGSTDLNILIRSFQRFGDRLTYQVGAGIVADSVPENEWNECLAKGKAMQTALMGEP